MEQLKYSLVSHITDNDIIKEVLNGNKDYYELIMRRYNQRLYRICRSYIKNDDDEVEDILQTTYIKAYENLKYFEFRSEVSTWLTRIVINETLTRLKKKKMYSNIEQNEENDLYNIYSIPTNMKNPEDEASNNELKESLEIVIDNLPEKYRTVFVLREIEGLSTFETGEALGISESNVKVRLNRAKEMLRNSLVSIYKEKEVFSFLGSRCDSIVFKVMEKIKFIEIM